MGSVTILFLLLLFVSIFRTFLFQCTSFIDLTFRHCSSVSYYLSYPRFADIYGLDLLDVKVFNNEMPEVPLSAFKHLGPEGNQSCSDNGQQPEPTIDNDKFQHFRTDMTLESKKTFMLAPSFEQPGASSNFMNNVKSKNVCLETARTDLNGCIFGLVRVANLAYHKIVTVIWTKNSWETVNEQSADYVAGSSQGGTDQFSFLLKCRELGVETKIELCLKFSCQGENYWDNNDGRNYTFHTKSIKADEAEKLNL